MKQPLQAELDVLFAEYREGLPRTLERIDALLAEGRHAELQRALHTLAGSAGTFGLPRVGEAARAAEEYLATRPDGGDELAGLLAKLRQVVKAAV